MRQRVHVERSLDHMVGRVEQRPTRCDAGIVHQHGDLENFTKNHLNVYIYIFKFTIVALRK